MGATNLQRFLEEAKVLHEAQLREARRSQPVRFAADVVETRVVEYGTWGRFFALELPNLISRGVETGQGLLLVEPRTTLGFVSSLDPENRLIELCLRDTVDLRGFKAVTFELRPPEFLILRERAALEEAVASASGKAEDLLMPQALPRPVLPLLSAAAEARLNPSQRAALANLMGSPDFAILWGPPGTGKTEVIAWLVEAWLREGRSVLLTSQQHRAVDEALIRAWEILSASGEPMPCTWRVGDAPKVDPRVRHLLSPPSGPAKLVAATLAATHSGILDGPSGLARFDHVIVDEAGRSTLAATIPALLRAHRSWVLCGDPEQLAPIVPEGVAHLQAARSPLAYYLEIPEVKSQRVAVLGESYRFGSAAVAAGTGRYYAARKISIEFPHARDTRPEQLVFCDTGPSSSVWRRFGRSFSMANPLEAAIVYRLVHEAAEGQRLESVLMVLTPFRLQCELLRSLFRPSHREMILSVDRSQGTEKPCVIVDLVAQEPAQLLRILPAAKLNVAWSRAREKLILVGNFSVVEAAFLAQRPASSDPAVVGLFEAVLEHGVIVRGEAEKALVVRAERKLELLCRPKSGGPTAGRTGQPGSSLTVLGALRRIPRAERPLVLGVHRVRGRRR